MTSSEKGHSKARVLLEPADLVGFEIDGRYRLEGVIGEGGMGVVFRSHQKGVQRDIAIKLLKPGGANSARRMERFEREISIISNLSHPNIVRVFDTGRDERLRMHYIAMELVKGVSLDTIMRSHLLKPEFALEVAYQICGALTEPHEKDIIHRDIKPENTLVVARPDDTVQVKVLDFGIARSYRGDGRVTTTGVVMGTPRYMAPESVRGGKIDARTDLYAVGVILFEMLVGQAPFAANTPVATMLQHVTQDAPSLSTALRGFQYAEVTQLVARLLDKDPESRPPSAREVRQSIDEIRDIYGFGRLKLEYAEDPVKALKSWLIPRDELVHGPNLDIPNRLSADSYEITGRMNAEEEEVGTDSGHLIPVPVDVARQHLRAQGLPAQAAYISEEGETDAIDLDFEFGETQALRSPTDSVEAQRIEVAPKPSNTPIVVAILVGVVAIVGAIVMLNQAPKPVQIGTEAVVEKAKPVPEVVEKKDNSGIVEAVSLGGNAGRAVSSRSRTLGEAVSKVKLAVKKVRKPEAKPESPKEKTEDKPKDTEFQKGLEWIRK